MMTFSNRGFRGWLLGRGGLSIGLGSLGLLALSLGSARVLAGKVTDSTSTGVVKPVATGNPALPNIPPPPDVAKPPADAEKTKSGLASKVLQKGTGTLHPKAGDLVEVNYAGWMTDGTLFDTSQKRGTTAKFPLHRLIEGWQEGLKLMVVGEKRRMWIPADLAYGDTPLRPGGPHGGLVFDVDLVNLVPDAVADQLPAAAAKKAQKSK